MITKPAGSDGRVNRETVSEQLLYEIGDPAHYLTPDVDVDFTTIELTDEGSDRVALRGVTGRPATDTYKVSLAYKAGYMASSQLLVLGRDCLAKARACADIIFARLRERLSLCRGQCRAARPGEGVPGLLPAAGRPARSGAAHRGAACRPRGGRALYPRSGAAGHRRTSRPGRLHGRARHGAAGVCLLAHAGAEGVGALAG